MHGRGADRFESAAKRWTFAASVWIATLPIGLTPPAVPPRWQLVSMIADDIDADGGLDVVANDGSLDLLVWINDGTGHLTEQHNGKPSLSFPKLSGSGLSDRGNDSHASAHMGSSFLQADSPITSVVTDDSRSQWTGYRDALPSSVVSTRSPRGPPFSFPA